VLVDDRHFVFRGDVRRAERIDDTTAEGRCGNRNGSIGLDDRIFRFERVGGVRIGDEDVAGIRQRCRESPVRDVGVCEDRRSDDWAAATA